MERIEILHKTPKGKLIGRTYRQPRINSFVVLKTRNKIIKIGKIYDVFGPVNKPYVKIIPLKNVDIQGCIGSKETFIVNSKKGAKSKNKR
ncbi:MULTISPECIES: Gar1/Naf1 family protein [Methanothermococcus]|uniref:Gar1/Naf1 family protein n=1 Tax=Methanothermococcus TaxID=155862 RepID=UPI00036EBA06|nr:MULTISPECIES: Gar1/Naf1 family protein [Methanothermococcus]